MGAHVEADLGEEKIWGCDFNRRTLPLNDSDGLEIFNVMIHRPGVFTLSRLEMNSVSCCQQAYIPFHDWYTEQPTGAPTSVNCSGTGSNTEVVVDCSSPRLGCSCFFRGSGSQPHPGSAPARSRDGG